MNGLDDFLSVTLEVRKLPTALLRCGKLTVGFFISRSRAAHPLLVFPTKSRVYLPRTNGSDRWEGVMTIK